MFAITIASRAQAIQRVATAARRARSTKVMRCLRISRYFRTDYPLYGHTKTKIVKSVVTFHGHNVGSF